MPTRRSGWFLDERPSFRSCLEARSRPVTGHRKLHNKQPMRIRLFGNLRISFAGRPVTAVNTNRLHSLIAYLILHGDTPQPRERLAFVLWPASSESQARTNLRQLLHHLKRALPADCNSLVTDHSTVRWRQDIPCAIDVVDFQAAIAEAALARTGQDRAREVQSLTTAAQLYEDD